MALPLAVFPATGIWRLTARWATVRLWCRPGIAAWRARTVAKLTACTRLMGAGDGDCGAGLGAT